MEVEASWFPLGQILILSNLDPAGLPGEVPSQIYPVVSGRVESGRGWGVEVGRSFHTEISDGSGGGAVGWNLILPQWFSAAVVLPPGGLLAMPGDILETFLVALYCSS